MTVDNGNRAETIIAMWYNGRSQNLQWNGTVVNGERVAAGSSISGTVDVGSIDANGGSVSGVAYVTGALSEAGIRNLGEEVGGVDVALNRQAYFRIPFSVRMTSVPVQNGVMAVDECGAVAADDVSL